MRAITYVAGDIAGSGDVFPPIPAKNRLDETSKPGRERQRRRDMTVGLRIQAKGTVLRNPSLNDDSYLVEKLLLHQDVRKVR